MITEIILTVNNVYTVKAIPCEIKSIHSKEDNLFSKISHLSAISKKSIINLTFAR